MDEIVVDVEKRTQETRLTMDVTEKQISKLAEYRQALITAAVTGKIDVRGEEAT